MKIAAVLLMLSLAIMVHESGHYAAMKANDVRVVEVGLGFGPALWSCQLPDGSKFKLGLILLGGYVEPVAEGPGSLRQAPVLARVEVTLAGMLMNVIAAALALIILGYVARPGKGAAGLVQKYGGWLPGWLAPLAVGLIAPVAIWLVTPPLIVWKLCTEGRKFFASMAGPVGIFSLGRQQFGSLSAAAGFWAIINVGLAGCNLIPLMPFDGGQTLLPFVEMLGSRAAQAYILESTFISLLFLAIVFLGDLWRLRKKPSRPDQQ